MNLDGSGETLLTPDGRAQDPAFSPDGRRLVFGSDAGGWNQTWVMDVDGSNATRLTYSYATEDHPVFSPDGRTIVFVGSGKGFVNLYLINATGPGARA
jgi:Tol biopolymer transport system component